MVIGYMAFSSMAVTPTPSSVMYNPSFKPRMGVCASVAFPKAKIFCTAYQGRNVLALRGGDMIQLSGSSTSMPFERRDRCGHAHMVPLTGSSKVRHTIPMTSAASKKNSYPPVTSNPRWWWRTLACVPYLLPLHEVWLDAENVYMLYPFMDKFSYLANPFIVTMQHLPPWFWMVQPNLVNFMVKREEIPHFLRFHIVVATLLSTAFGIKRMVCMSVPEVIFRGRLSYFWMLLAFMEMVTVLNCMQCSLRGMYGEVPFISDAAYKNISM